MGSMFASLNLMGLFKKILRHFVIIFKARGITSRNERQGQQQSLLRPKSKICLVWVRLDVFWRGGWTDAKFKFGFSKNYLPISLDFCILI